MAENIKLTEDLIYVPNAVTLTKENICHHIAAAINQLGMREISNYRMIMSKFAHRCYINSGEIIKSSLMLEVDDTLPDSEFYIKDSCENVIVIYTIRPE